MGFLYGVSTIQLAACMACFFMFLGQASLRDYNMFEHGVNKNTMRVHQDLCGMYEFPHWNMIKMCSQAMIKFWRIFNHIEDMVPDPWAPDPWSPRSMGPPSMGPWSMDPWSMGPWSKAPRSMGPRFHLISFIHSFISFILSFHVIHSCISFIQFIHSFHFIHFIHFI